MSTANQPWNAQDAHKDSDATHVNNVDQSQSCFDHICLNREQLKRSSGWFIFAGLITFLSGLAAIIVPQAAALAVNWLLGGLLIVHGLVQGFYAFYLRGLKGFVWQSLGALAALVAGGALLAFPAVGLASLTLLVASFLIVAGGLKVGLAWRLKPLNGWVWMMVNGVLVTLLGALIVLQWPQASAWILGLLVGIDLSFSGVWLMMVGWLARKDRAA